MEYDESSESSDEWTDENNQCVITGLAMIISAIIMVVVLRYK